MMTIRSTKTLTILLLIRSRISQLEEQLASLTQWVQNSIEAESSGHTSVAHKGESFNRYTNALRMLDILEIHW